MNRLRHGSTFRWQTRIGPGTQVRSRTAVGGASGNPEQKLRSVVSGLMGRSGLRRNLSGGRSSGWGVVAGSNRKQRSRTRSLWRSKTKSGKLSTLSVKQATASRRDTVAPKGRLRNAQSANRTMSMTTNSEIVGISLHRSRRLGNRGGRFRVRRFADLMDAESRDSGERTNSAGGMPVTLGGS